MFNRSVKGRFGTDMFVGIVHRAPPVQVAQRKASGRLSVHSSGVLMDFRYDFHDIYRWKRC